VILRDVRPDDVEVILGLIRDLAAFEREPDAVKMTEAQLHAALFGAQPRGEALLAETPAGVQGFAIWYETLNTWTGRPGLYVEDVYVVPEARGLGIGRAIFVHIAKLAVSKGCSRMEWSVLKWNETAIRFYESLGARAESEWQKYRLSGDTLAALAA
jgi:GNAT superfamily N-acetyltransferase